MAPQPHHHTHTPAAPSRFVAAHHAATVPEMLSELGYNTGRHGEKLEAAMADFSRDHHNAPATEDKLKAVVEQAHQDQKQFHDLAPNMTLAQAHALRTAAQDAHIPLAPLVKLAAGQRAFDNTFTAAQGRKPGMIQMSDESWLATVQKFGQYFPQTQALAARMNAPDKTGHVTPAAKLPAALKHEALALRDNLVVSAEIGAQYAKHNPVQLDTIKCYLHETGKHDAKHLEILFSKQGGIHGFDPSLMHMVKGRLHQLNPWCAAMVNTTLATVGAPEAKRGNAVNLAAEGFADYGKPVDPHKGAPVKPGDIVVFTHADGTHHVAFVYDVQGQGEHATFRTIGGNQAGGPGGAVSISHPRPVLAGGSQPCAHHHTKHGSKLAVTASFLFREPPPNAFAEADLRHNATLMASRAPSGPVLTANG